MKKDLLFVLFVILSSILPVNSLYAQENESKLELRGARPPGTWITSLDTAYCSDVANDDIVPNTWEPATTVMTWKVSAWSVMNPNQPTWYTVTGIGKTTVLHLNPSAIPPAFHGIPIVLSYVQSDGVGDLSVAYDYTYIYTVPSVKNFGSDTTLCPGESVNLVLDGSEIGMRYVLLSGGAPVDSLNGTGASLSFNVSVAGTYTVRAKNNLKTVCDTPMNGTAVVDFFPPNVPTINGPANVCIGTLGSKYTTEIGQTNYVWTVSAGGTIVAGAGTYEITVDWSTTGAKTITVNYDDVNLCQATTPTTFTTTVRPLPVPALNGLLSVCISDILAYSTDPGMSNYAWTVTAGGTITAGALTASPTISWTTLGTQTVTVTYIDTYGCIPAAPTSRNVEVRDRPIPTIAGNQNVCVGVTGVTYTTEAGYSAYAWTVPTGGTITAGAGTRQITVTWNTAGAHTVTVNYQNAFGCPALNPTVWNVTVNPVPAVTPMTAITCSNIAFSSTPVDVVNGVVLPGTLYTWAAPVVTGGMTGGVANAIPAVSITGTLTNSTNSSQTATYTVTPISGICPGLPFTLVVTVNPIPAITPVVATTCSAVAFSSTPVNVVNGVVPVGTTYTWGVPVVTGGMTGGAANAVPAASITGTLTNTTNSNQTATYTVFPTAGTCPVGLPFTLTVTVKPVPALNPMLATTCSNAAFSSTPVDGVNGVVPVGTQYTWTAPVVTGGMTGGVANVIPVASITGTLSNPTSSPQTATYTVTPRVNGCTGPTFTLTVTVDPVAAITPMTAITCTNVAFSSTPVDVVNGVVPAGTLYTWAIPVVTGGMTGGAANAIPAASITGTLTNATSTSQTATYTVTPTTGGCPSGPTFTLTVTVNPIPAITPVVATTCSAVAFSSTPVNVVNGVVPVGTTYTWGVPVVTGGMTGGAANAVPAASISGTLTNTTNSNQTATYTVTPTTAGCPSGLPFTLTVTVKPVPALNPMLATTCSNVAFSSTPVDGVNGVVPVGTQYTWTAPVVTGGMTGGVANAIPVASITGTLSNTTNFNQTATYTVTPRVNGCTGPTFTLTVTVTPVPAITPMTAITCTNVAFSSTPVDVVNGVVPIGTLYTWALPVVTGGMTGGAANAIPAASITGTLTNATSTSQTATYTVTPTTVGCPSGPTFTLTVTVNPTPNITPVIATTCSAIAFTSTPVDVVNGVVPAGTTYTWGFPVVTGGMTGGAANGVPAASITGTLTNTTNSNQTATYTVTPTTGGCPSGPPFTLTVTVKPVPTINPMLTTTCSNVAFSSTPVDGVNGVIPGGTTYTWTAPVVTGGMTGGVANAVPAASITGTLINTTSSSQTATYTVTPRVNGCTGSSFIITVTVSPIPAVTPMTAITCTNVAFSSTPVDVVNGVVPVGTLYTWAIPIVTGGMTGGAANAVPAASITGTLTNTTSTSQTATYTVTPTTGGCPSGPTFSLTVTVNPIPAITPMATSACNGVVFSSTPVNMIDGVVPAGTTYTWLAPVVTGGMSGGVGNAVPAASISGTLTNPTSTPQTATYTVTPTAGTCPSGAPFIVTVTVNPSPGIMPMATTTCSGIAFSSTPVDVVNGSVPVGTLYTWDAPVVTGGLLGGVANAIPVASISGTLNNPTNIPRTATYTVTPSVGGCPGPTFTLTVTVNPVPVITPMTTITCTNVAFSSIPVNGLNGIVPVGTMYTWGVPAVTGGMTGGVANAIPAAVITGTLANTSNSVQTATYTITPTKAGCPSGATFTLTVTVNPIPALTPMTAITCGSTAFSSTPIDVTNGVVPPGTQYTWPAPVVTGGMTGGVANAVPAASITGTLTNITTFPQTATYTVTPTVAGCVAGATFTLTVTVDPIPTISPMTATTCSNIVFTTTPVDVINGVIPPGTTYTWPAPVVTGGMTGGAGAAGANISGTLNNPTNIAQTATYTVTPSAGGCSGPTFTVTTTVNPVPAITPMTAVICNSGSFTSIPVNGVNGVVPVGTTYSWPLPVVTGGVTGGAVGVSALNITGILSNPTMSVQTATYTVTPLAGLCPAGPTFTVTVTINPIPTITPMVTTTCSGAAFSSSPVDVVNGVVPPGTQYTWTAPIVTGGMTGGVANGVPSPTITGTLNNPNTTVQTAVYTVTPSVAGCVGPNFIVTVTVNPTPVIAPMNAMTCSGIAFSTTPVDVTNGIVPPGTTYSWPVPIVTGGMTGGAGASGASISGTLTNPTSIDQTGTYNVIPTAGTCTGNSFPVTVTVNPRPQIAAMTANACSSTAFLSTPVDITNGVVPIGTTYTWAAPIVTGGMTGGVANAVPAGSIIGTLTNTTSTTQTATYTVTPTTGSCVGAAFTLIVTVNPVPAVNPMIATTCDGVGFTSTPVNVVNGIVPLGTLYTWTAPVVSGGMTGGVANAVPAANIIGTLTNPTNTSQTATYTVTPTVSGCPGATFTLIVTVNPIPAITPMTASACTGVAFTSVPVNSTNGIVPAGTTYTWGVPVVTGGMTGGVANGAPSASIFGTLTNSTSSSQTATYTVTPTSGTCPAGATFTVTVTVNPTPFINPMIETVCSGVGFTSTPVDVVNGVVPVGTLYTWTAPVVTGGLTGGVANAIPLASISGTLVNPTNIAQTATYTVTPVVGGCPGATFTVTVTVNTVPGILDMTQATCTAVAFSATPVNIANGIVPPGTLYTWSAPIVTGGITGGSANAVPVANITGTLTNNTGSAHTATYTVTPTSAGCIAPTFTLVVTVNPIPAISPMNLSACSGVNFSSTPVDVVNGIVPPGTTYTWPAPVVTGGITGGVGGAGVNIVGTLTNPTGVAQTATYTITPTIGTCSGTPFSLLVTVNTIPTLSSSLTPAPLCSNTAFLYTATSSTAGVIFSWSRAVVAGISNGAGSGVTGIISETLINTTAAPIVVTYAISLTANGCTNIQNVQVTVNPAPAVFNIIPSGFVADCNPATAPKIRLSDSELGVNYSLYKDGLLFSMLPGDGGQLDFGVQPQGAYTIVGVNVAFGCITPMNGAYFACYPFEAIPDTLYLDKEQSTISLNVSVPSKGGNDDITPIIDTNTNLSYSLITSWIDGNGNNVQTKGTVSLSLLNKDYFTYTKPDDNFYGKDSVLYVMANVAYPTRIDTAVIYILVGNKEIKDEKLILIPNAFTPNGDGKNDIFIISEYEEQVSSNLKIFNRWGALVYESEGKEYGNNWDGIGNKGVTISIGKELPDGTYFYVYQVSFKQEDKIVDKKYSGYVELRR